MSETAYSPVKHLRIGFIALFILVVLFGGWAFAARLSGAVIAVGQVQVDSNRQVIEHAEGGIVQEILRRDGDFVASGDVLIRLDAKLLSAELASLEGQYFELLARQARLIAERELSTNLSWPDALEIAALSDETITQMMLGQKRLFERRVRNLSAEQDQLHEQITALSAEQNGIAAQLRALKIQSELAASDLSDAQALFEKGFANKERIVNLERESARLAGETGRLEASAAQSQTKQAELRITELRLISTRQEEAIQNLRDIELQLLEINEARAALQERVSRLEIKAPVSGLIYGQLVFAENSVISAAEPLMYIVPQDRPLVIAARVDAVHIDAISLGQRASLRFPSLDQKFTPEIIGEVTKLSADVIIDEATGQQFYAAEIVPIASELSKLGDQSLIPGLPVETYIETAARSPMHYLTKPLTDYFRKAWLEE